MVWVGNGNQEMCVCVCVCECVCIRVYARMRSYVFSDPHVILWRQPDARQFITHVH